MPSFSLDEMQQYTRPLCAPEQYEQKVANYHQVEASFASRTEYCAGMPVHLHVEATPRCNLTCPMCPTGRGLITRSEPLSLTAFRQAFDQLIPGLANICISGWGEPLLNPATPAMIHHAISNGVSVFLNTNGTVLDQCVDAILEAHLTLITVALDGAVSRRTHVYNEEFSFRRVVQAVELLKRRKEQGSYRHPLIQAKFIVTEETVDELDALRAWAFNLGVEHVKVKRKFRMMPGRLERGKIYSLPQLETIHQHAVVRSTEELDFTPLGCSHPWDSVFLAGDGQFGLCSWDPRDVVKLGPAHADFARLWNGEALRQVRRWHTGQGAVGDPCRKCNRLPGHLWQGAAHAVPG